MIAPSAAPQPFRLAAQSTARTAITRYLRSKGLWILLLAGLLGARFWLPRDDGTAVIIAIDNRLPELSSAIIGLSLGTVLATLLLPFGFIYLRANVTRRQPWQIVDVSPASRVALSLGAFAADTAILFVLLAVMAVAGWLMAWFTLPASEIHLWQIALTLGLTAIPTVMGLAAIRRLFAAFALTRRAFGDFLFFCLWMFSLMTPLFSRGALSSYRANLWDFGGAIQPLGHFGHGLQSLNIGFGTGLLPDRFPADVLPVLLDPAYLAARLTIAVAAIALAALAGLLYRPQTAKLQHRKASRLLRWLAASPATPAAPTLTQAPASRLPLAGLVLTELRLIFASRLSRILAVAAALSGLLGDYRHHGSQFAFLLLIFGLTAQAAREETRGMLALTLVTPFTPTVRRTAFVAAGLLASFASAAPSFLLHPSQQTVVLAAILGTGAALFTIFLTTLTRSAFAARLLLLLVWYGYISVH